MTLLQRARNLGTDGGADALVTHIAQDGFTYPEGEADYVTKYFNADVRKAVFSGGSYDGRSIRLSSAAGRLKSAFQRRFATHGDFRPHTAYHVTAGAHIAGMIAETGFIAATSTMLGLGAYFWNTPAKAEDYIPGTPCMGEKVILEVTIFSTIATLKDQVKVPIGWADVLTSEPTKLIWVVKNPLLIFPKAVFYPGEMKMHSGADGIAIVGRVVL